MLSIVLTVICLGALFLTYVSQSKVKTLVNENIHVSKNNLEFRTDFIKMNKDIENLMNVSQDLNKSNNLLRKSNEKIMVKYDQMIMVNQKLEKRVSYLEEENKKIKAALENYNLIAPAFKIDKSFAVKLVK